MKRGESGSATEMAILTPVFIAFLLAVTLTGRVVMARGTVEGAARDGARAAAVARSPSAAIASGGQAARSSLAMRCVGTDVAVNAANHRPGGRVTVTVSCVVRLSDLSLLRVGGDRTVTARATEVVDVYRGTGDVR